MGCDIHAMYERKKKIGEHFSYWINAGDPSISRNYELFAIIGNVRNEDSIPFIGADRFDMSDEYWYETKENECCTEFSANTKWWCDDGHSHSWVSLKELKEYDINQTYHSRRLISSKDEDGNITGTCAWSSGETFGEVGESTPFGLWGTADWDELIQFGERIAEQHDLTDEEVRLSFLFDN